MLRKRRHLHRALLRGKVLRRCWGKTVIYKSKRAEVTRDWDTLTTGLPSQPLREPIAHTLILDVIRVSFSLLISPNVGSSVSAGLTHRQCCRGQKGVAGRRRGQSEHRQ